MQQGSRLPEGQAEVVVCDHVIDWMLEHLTVSQREVVLDRFTTLFENPAGKHALGNRAGSALAGLNTLEADGTELRVVYRAGVENVVGVIEILAVGPRRGSAVYDMVTALLSSGKISEAEQTQIWDMLRLLDDEKKRLGLEDWDYREPTDPNLVKTVVAAGLLDQDVAELLGRDELVAAMSAGWSENGADPQKALAAAMARVRTSAAPERILRLRRQQRCGAFMPKAQEHCIRVAGHKGAHRARR